MPETSKTSVPRVWPVESPAIRKTFELNVDDHLAIAFATRQLLPTGVFGGGIALIALFVALIINHPLLRDGDIVRFAIHVGATVALCALMARALVDPARWAWREMIRRRLTRMGMVGGPIDSTIDPEGLHYVASGRSVSCPWPTLQAIEEDDDAIYFWMTKRSAHPWPARIFESEADKETVRARIREWSGRAIISPPMLARLGEAGRNRLVE